MFLAERSVSLRKLAQLVWLLLVLPTFPLPAAAQVQGPAGQFLLWPDGSSFTTFGANEAIVVDSGRMDFVNSCSSSGFDDFITPATDVYIVPAGSVAPGDSLFDVSGVPSTVFGATDGSFISETIGYTQPSGTIGAGLYAVVFNECQDGVLDPYDFVLDPAFEVVLPASLPPIDSAIVQAKDAASAQAEFWALGESAVELMFGVKRLLSALRILRSSSGTDLDLAKLQVRVWYRQVKLGWKALSGVNPETAALTRMRNMSAHYQGIAADPPDPNFEQFTLITSVNHAPALDEDTLVAVLEGKVGRRVAIEEALALAFLTAIERYQGAANAFDSDWAVTHIRNARTFANLIALSTAKSAIASDAVHDELIANIASIDSALAQLDTIGQRVVVGGLNDAEREGLRDVGLTDSEIVQLRDDFIEEFGDGLSTSDLLDAFQGIGAGSDAASAVYAVVSDSLESIARRIETQHGPDLQRPIAVLPSSYSAVVGDTIRLNGSASYDSDGDVRSWSWDFDADGQFDDASGERVSLVVQPQTSSIVGLQVSDELGNRAITYSFLEIANPNQRPYFGDASTPGEAIVQAQSAETTLFVDGVDPEGGTLSYSWYIDGELLGSGDSFTVSQSDIGLYGVSVVVEDANGGRTARLWPIAVVDPEVLTSLSVASPAPLYLQGLEGGPFEPACQTLTVTSTGTSTVQWRISEAPVWITFDPPSGDLAPGESVELSACANAGTASLAPGIYEATVTVLNENTGGAYPQEILVIVSGDEENVVFDASLGMFPNEQCPRWNLGNTSSASEASFVGDVLQIHRPVSAGYMFYQQIGDQLISPDVAIVDFEARYVTGGTSRSTHSGILVSVVPIPDHQTIFFIGDDSIWLWSQSGIVGERIQVPTKDALHSYRLAIDTSSLDVSLFYDGALALSGSLWTTNEPRAIRVSWGDGTGYSWAQQEWRSLSHNMGNPLRVTDADGDGYTPCEGDCDDSDSSLSPGADEVCDFVDNDCDGTIDNTPSGDCFTLADVDGDGVRPVDGDCNDHNPLTRPTGYEVCDGMDNDCDGLIDEDLACYDGPMRVLTMPETYRGSNNVPRPATWIGRDAILWGKVEGGTGPYTYSWDPGDGSPPVTGEVTDPRYVRTHHAYQTLGPKFAALTVTDVAGTSVTDDVRIDVGQYELETRVEAAKVDGLRYLYLQQVGEGYWLPYGSRRASGMMALAFQLRGHSKTNSPEEDIYAETLLAFWDQIFSTLQRRPVPNQWERVPDSNGNGYGLTARDFYTGYDHGLLMMAMGTMDDLDEVVQVGSEAGRTVREVLQDFVDQVAYSQQDFDSYGNYRGGWRYNIRGSRSGADNSVTQWVVLGLEAAEAAGCHIHAFLRPELERFTSKTQYLNSGNWKHGAFAYQEVGFSSRNIALTGSGLIQLGWIGRPITDSQVEAALSYLQRRWLDKTDLNPSGSRLNGHREHLAGNFYAMYSMKKGLEQYLPATTFVGSYDWQDVYNRTLVYDPERLYDNAGGVTWSRPEFDTAMMEQNIGVDDYLDGSWGTREPFDLGQWLVQREGAVDLPEVVKGKAIATANNVLILHKGVLSAVPVAICEATPPQAGPGDLITFDGSKSYHQNLSQEIVSYLWDFDASDGIDFVNPDSTGFQASFAYDLPAGVQSQTYTATLRVRDDAIPANERDAQCTVLVTRGNNPPVAVPGGPYAACVGEPILLDGSGSYDPDEDEGDAVVSYHWDLDGDGQYDDYDGPTTTVTFNEIVDGFVGLQVVDSNGVHSENTNAIVRIFTARGDLSTDENSLVLANESICEVGAEVCVEGSYTVVNDDPLFDVPAVKVEFYLDSANDPANRLDVFEDTDLFGGQTVSHQVCFSRADQDSHAVIMVIDRLQAINECVETDNTVVLSLPCGQNEPPMLTTVVPQNQTVQYSDKIAPVMIGITDDVYPRNGDFVVTASWYRDGLEPVYGLPAGLELTDNGCALPIDGIRECSWALEGQILEPAGPVRVILAAEDGESVSEPDTITIAVSPEATTVSYPDTNPFTIQVAQDGGDSGQFTLKATIRELDDPRNVLGDSLTAGDISLVSVYTSLIPVGPGGTITPVDVCIEAVTDGLEDPDSPFNYDALTVTCTYAGVPVNTYAFTVIVDGAGYYVGGDETALVVFDPSLGFTTGGGWFYWPGTADPDVDYPGDRTNFGFNAKYTKKGNQTKGSLLVIRRLADNSHYRLKANKVDGLAVSEVPDGDELLAFASFLGKATYKEPDWLEPIGNHLFEVYVEEYGEPGTGMDRFWLRLENAGELPTTGLAMSHPARTMAVTIQGGNIQIPHDGGLAREVDLPQVYALRQNWPNPFNPETTIAFDLPEEAHVKLVVYNVAGRVVERLVDDPMPAGTHSVRWRPQSIASGVYVYRMVAGDFVQQRRMLLLK